LNIFVGKIGSADEESQAYAQQFSLRVTESERNDRCLRATTQERQTQAREIAPDAIKRARAITL
jgi:hypothetical protein